MLRALLFTSIALLLPSVALAQTPASGPAIENGSTVQFEYTLTDDGGTLIGSNKGQQPVTYTQGRQQIMAALEAQLTGLRAGDEKQVVLKPEEAYGPVDPAAHTEVPKASLPPDALVVGTALMARNAAGEERPVVVKEIKGDTVVLDLNHPLAGRTLVFDVRIVSVAPPKPDAAGANGSTVSKPGRSEPSPAKDASAPAKDASPAAGDATPSK
jgi:FKBP-type peptidyl-prolyl cis-trans isomerase SlyD